MVTQFLGLKHNSFYVARCVYIQIRYANQWCKIHRLMCHADLTPWTKYQPDDRLAKCLLQNVRSLVKDTLLKGLRHNTERKACVQNAENTHLLSSGLVSVWCLAMRDDRGHLYQSYRLYLWSTLKAISHEIYPCGFYCGNIWFLHPISIYEVEDHAYFVWKQS